jgi:hypothetical protein
MTSKDSDIIGRYIALNDPTRYEYYMLVMVIEVGIVLIIEIDDNILFKSYVAIGSKLIELVNERLITLYDDILVGC